MGDGIARGIGSELGNLGKQIAQEIVQVPAKITGMDAGTNEVTGTGTGGKKAQKGQSTQANRTASMPGEYRDPLSAIRQKDEVEKQKQLALARQLLQKFMHPQQEEPSLKQKQEMEEMEKRKKEIKEENEKAKKQLPQMTAKRPRGDLYGVKAKQFGGEKGKNVKAQ